MKRVFVLILALFAVLAMSAVAAQTKKPKSQPPSCGSVKVEVCPDGACQKFCICQTAGSSGSYKCGCKPNCGGKAPVKL